MTDASTTTQMDHHGTLDLTLLIHAACQVLDEATSNVDNDTDEIVQKTVRRAFKNCTVLTIAHRLHTIIDADRILLLDAGQVGEFDSPEVLLKASASLQICIVFIWPCIRDTPLSREENQVGSEPRLRSTKTCIICSMVALH